MKNNWNELGIFGGKPTFENELHVGRPNIGNRERLLDRINDLFDRRWFTNNGPYVREFEKRLVDLLGVKHCIPICNGTVALEIATRALELTSEVIIPSFTFIATAHALQWQGIRPVFCDIEPDSHTIDPRQVERLITPRTSGIIGVHLWGRPCNVEALEDIAHRYRVKLLFDAAHAFGCSCKGRMIGNFGQAEVFSFHATKCVNTFEGGAIATNDDELAAKIRLMKNFGFAGYDNVIYIGTNGKMSEIAAAMGITGLEDVEGVFATNSANYKEYQSELENIPGVNLIIYDETEKYNYHYIILEIEESASIVSRDQLVDILHAENILARRYFYPGCHRMEPYRSHFPHHGELLPHTERLAKQVLSLPTGTAVSSKDISKICEIIRTVVANGAEVQERLSGHKKH